MESFDLNKAKGRKVVELSLGSKTFRISRVVTGVRQLYADYMVQTGEIMEKVEQLEPQEGESRRDHRSRIKGVSKQVEEFSDYKKELYYEMLDLILTRNGYELDRKWWEQNADEFDQQQFLEICLTKDAPSQKKTTMENGLTTSG